MNINKKMNLVIPVSRGEVQLYVHSTPISREIFEQHFLILAKTFGAIHEEGIGFATGPRISAMLLKRIADREGVWDGPSGVQNTLMNEVRRISNVILPGDKGWTMTPLQVAVDQKLLEDDEISEVENAIVFFIVGCALHKRSNVPTVLNGMAALWGTQTTLLNVSEYMTSLPILTAIDNSGAPAALSVPS